MDPSFTRSVLPIKQFRGKVYEERERFTIRRWYKSYHSYQVNDFELGQQLTFSPMSILSIQLQWMHIEYVLLSCILLASYTASPFDSSEAAGHF